MKKILSFICLAMLFGAQELLSQDIVGKWHGVNCSGIEVVSNKTMFIANNEEEFKYRIRKDQLFISNTAYNSIYGYVEDYTYDVKLLTEDSLIIVPHTAAYNLLVNEMDSRLFFVRIKD